MSKLQALRDRLTSLGGCRQPCLKPRARDPDAAAELEGRDVVPSDRLVELPATNPKHAARLVDREHRGQLSEHHSVGVERVRHWPLRSVLGRPARYGQATG